MLNKKSFFQFIVFMAAVLLLYPATCLSAGAPTGNVPATGDIFPAEDLKVPEKGIYRQYLGLDADKETFQLKDIQAEFAVVQIFSMYCPICQREAREVNKLYELIQGSDAADKVKLLAIAPGNSAFEVSVYREQYDVQFPLIPDGEYEWHKIMGEVGTPYFLIVDLDTGEILEDELGPFGTAQDFFELIELILKHVD